MRNHSVKTIIPLQAWGLGDIIFTQTLLQEYRSFGLEVVWPVKVEFLAGLQEAYPQMKFIPDTMIKTEWFDIKQFKEVHGVYILPIRWAESIMGRPYHLHMKSKYELCEMNWAIWKRYAMPQRNALKENELFQQLGISPGMKYNFVNTTFGSKGERKISITPSNDYPVVELKFIPGYSLFDWCGVIKHAANIYSVSTSTLYLYELLDLEAEAIHLYTRKPVERDFKYVEFLFTKNYILHQ